jgi:hypothetical protein
VRQGLLMCVVVASFLAALIPGVAGARAPLYDVACAVGVQTTVTWQHAKLDQATFTWLAPTDSGVTFDPVVVPLTPTPPHGFIVTATASSINGISPVSVMVSFEHPDGSLDQVEVACA